MKSSSSQLSHTRLTQLLDYDMDDGLFRWKVARGGSIEGEVAGSSRRDGYIAICIDRGRFLAHRLAIFYVTGVWPISEVDHCDGDRKNNSYLNLREASRKENSYNHKTRCDNTSGVRGVTFKKDKGKWRATIQKDNKSHHIGYYDSFDEAVIQRKLAAIVLFGEFAGEVSR